MNDLPLLFVGELLVLIGVINSSRLAMFQIGVMRQSWAQPNGLAGNAISDTIVGSLLCGHD